MSPCARSGHEVENTATDATICQQQPMEHAHHHHQYSPQVKHTHVPCTRLHIFVRVDVHVLLIQTHFPRGGCSMHTSSSLSSSDSSSSESSLSSSSLLSSSELSAVKSLSPSFSSSSSSESSSRRRALHYSQAAAAAAVVSLGRWQRPRQNE